MGLRLPWKREPEAVTYADFPDDAELVTLIIGETTYSEQPVIRTPDKVLNFRIVLPGVKMGTPVEMVWTADGRGGEGEGRIVRATQATIGVGPTRVSSGLQRRGSLRVPTNVPLTLTGPEGVTYQLSTRNVSLGGALVVGRGPAPEPGEVLPGRLDLPGQFVTVNAAVVPGLDPPGVLRLTFVGLTPQAEDLIADYVAAQERRKAHTR